MAIENARLYESIRANEVRLEKEVRFAQRVQMALLPQELPKKLKGVDVAWHFDPARELGGDIYEFLSPEPNTLVVAVGDVSGKGVPAALYSSFVGEVVRGRTFRRRFTPELASPANLLTSLNRILHERQLEEYYCTLCYASFDLKRTTAIVRQLGPAVSRPRVGRHRREQIELAGVPLGSFGASTYDEVTRRAETRRRVRVLLRWHLRDLQRIGRGVRLARVIVEVAREHADKPAKEIVGGRLRRDAGVPRRRAADRRSDRRRRQDRRRRSRPSRRRRRQRETMRTAADCRWRSLAGVVSPAGARASEQTTGPLQQALTGPARDAARGRGGAPRRRARLRRRRPDVEGSTSRRGSRTSRFPTASTIKLSILYELLKQAEEQKLVLDKPAPSSIVAQMVGGSGVLQHLAAPMLSLIDHAALMIIVSDNTATNVVIDAVGMANVTARMKALGLADIQLRRKMMDAAAVERGDENVASPASLARIAEIVWRGDGLRPESRDAGRRILYQVRRPDPRGRPRPRPRREQDRQPRQASAPKRRSWSSKAARSRSPR